MLQRGEIKIRNGMYFMTGQIFCVLKPKAGRIISVLQEMQCKHNSFFFLIISVISCFVDNIFITSVLMNGIVAFNSNADELFFCQFSNV